MRALLWHSNEASEKETPFCSSIRGEVVDWYNKSARKLRPYLLFTEKNTVRRMMNQGCKTILDIGCGTGELARFINKDRKFHIVGLDLCKVAIREAKRNDYYSDCVVCDARSLPFKKKSFDQVCALEVIEHLYKESGRRLFKEMEDIARIQVIISCPVEWPVPTYQTAEEYLYGHKASWKPSELKEQGYKVRGLGLRGIRLSGSGKGERGLWYNAPWLLRPLILLIWVFSGPFVWFFPKLADNMVAMHA